MQIACFLNSYGRFGPQAAFDLLAGTGVRWVELPIKTAGQPSIFGETPVLTDASTDADVEQVKAQLAAAELRVCSCNITSGNVLEPEAIERTLRKLELAAKFEVRYVVGGGGAIESANDWPQLVNHLQRIGHLAASLGIVYCCETHPGAFQNADAMLETLERVDHPNVQLNFDTANLFYYNQNPSIMDELQRVSELIRHVHLKDTDGQFEHWYFPELGAGGAVDFRQVRTFLKSINFRGPCSLEIEGIRGEAELSLEQTHERIVASIAHLRSCGWTIPQ